jgi:hypothetical protein
MTRIPVKLNPFAIPETAASQLHVCKNCGIYTLLPEEYCTHCSNVKGYYPMDQFIAKKFRLRSQSNFFLLISLLFIGLIFTFDLVAFTLLGLVGLITISTFSVLQFKNRSSEKKHILLSQITSDKDKIIRGLEMNKEYVEKKIEDGHFLEAYEILRTITLFWNDDSIKDLKLKCLNHFVIRKDMPLEMDSIIPDSFSDEFILYLESAVKVQRNLVNRNVIEYVMNYEEEIKESSSNELFVLVAGAALRMKQYFIAYESFIMNNVEYMSKERIIRLKRLLESIDTHDVQPSKDRVEELIRTKYYSDPEVMAHV